MELTVDQALQKGISAHKAGQLQEAEKYYKAILNSQPEHPDANHNMGVLAVAVSKVAEALPFFKKALEANPGIVQFWQSYIDALITLDRLEDAKDMFDQAKSKLLIGDAFDKLEKRLLKSSKAESIKPNSSLLDEAIELRDSGNFSQAIDILKDKLTKFPHDPEILALLSHCYLLTDDIETATIQLDQAKSLNANSALVAWNEVRLLLKNKSVAEALVVARRANKLFPEDVEGMGVLGSCLRANNKLEESITFLDKAIELNPNYAEALINRGLIQLSQGDKVTALADLKQAHRLKPHMKQIWSTTVNLTIEAKQYAEAISLLIRMIEDNPKHEKSFSLLTACIQEADDNALAINSYKKILEIKPDDAYITLNLGIAFQRQGETGLAIDSFQAAIEINPDFADAHYNLGIVLANQGKFKDAIVAYNKALSIKPDYVAANNNLGIVLTNQGKFEDAIVAFKKVINSKENLSAAYYNMGIAFAEQGKLEKAVEAYRMAIASKPDFADAHHNLGNALYKQGKLEKAIEAYYMAIASKPDFADAQYNLGNALYTQGKLEKAVEAYSMAIAFKPNFPKFYASISIALKNFRFAEPNQGMQEIILDLLERQTYSRPQDIAIAAISLLKFEPVLMDIFERFKKDQLILRPKETVTALSKSQVLLKLMSVCPIADLEFEALFTNIRASLLLSASDPTATCEKFCFQTSLALQCFTNEYIFKQNDDEIKAVKDLETLVNKILKKGDQPDANLILCLASYKALYEYEWCDLLTINTDIEAVFIRQVIEPISERRIKSTIPVLDEITNEVSSKVRMQYEANPYPRWVQLGLHLQPMSISAMVEKSNLKLFDQRIIKVEAPDILVAGCGTGQHSLDTAGRFLNSKVLAIDLSLSSLAYAKRKTEELEFKNIKYLQSDILNLGKLDRQFDIVESSGVLHHMDDPRAGWKVLAQCLKKGGLMKIGLYSELARKKLVQIRQEIKESGVQSTAVSMKSVRSDIINSEKAHHRQIQNSADFFSLSSLRDLLFHVQEYRFNIPEIRDCLDELGLVFCGFESEHLVRYFKNINTGSDDSYNLDKWNSFEQANPHSFAGMYQFWCQKIT